MSRSDVAAHGAEHDDLQQLLPWFVNGTLEPAERARVTRHVERCERCRQALDQWHALADTVRMGKAQWTPPASHFDRMMSELDGASRAPPTVGARWRQWLSGWRMTPAPARWALAAQTAVVIALGALLLARGPVSMSPAYITLTAPAGDSNAARQQSGVQAGFAGELRLEEMNALLDRIDAQVVSGPSRLGVYQLAFADADGAAGALEVLRQHDGVTLAEPVELDATTREQP